MQPYRVWLFSDLIEKNKRVFKVPVYQRNYDWTSVQCEKLYQDIMLAVLFSVDTSSTGWSENNNQLVIETNGADIEE